MLDLFKCILPLACILLLHKTYIVACLAFTSKERKINLHVRIKKNNSITQIANSYISNRKDI